MCLKRPFELEELKKEVNFVCGNSLPKTIFVYREHLTACLNEEDEENILPFFQAVCPMSNIVKVNDIYRIKDFLFETGTSSTEAMIVINNNHPLIWDCEIKKHKWPGKILVLPLLKEETRSFVMDSIKSERKDSI